MTPAERLFEANVRVETFIWTGGIAADPPECFEDFVQDDLPDAKRVIAALPWLSQWVKGDADAEEIACEFTNQADGFLVKLARPIPTSFGPDGKSHAFSWGYYQTEWFYVQTLVALADEAERWSEEVVDRARLKAA